MLLKSRISRHDNGSSAQMEQLFFLLRKNSATFIFCSLMIIIRSLETMINFFLADAINQHSINSDTELQSNLPSLVSYIFSVQLSVNHFRSNGNNTPKFIRNYKKSFITTNESNKILTSTTPCLNFIHNPRRRKSN